FMKKESGFVLKSKACAVPGCGHRTPHAGHLVQKPAVSRSGCDTCEFGARGFRMQSASNGNPSRSSAVEIERGGAQHRRQSQASYQVTRTLKRGQQSITHCGGPSSKQCRQHKEMTLATILRLPRRSRQRPRAPSQFLSPVVRHESYLG